MANFPLLWALGAPYKGLFTSAKATEMDERFPKIPNWIGGSDHTLDASAVVALRGTTGNSNKLLLDVPVEIATGKVLTATGSIVVPSAGKFSLQGRRRKAAIVTLSDNSQTIDVTMGTRFELTNTPALPRIITIDDSTGSPEANEIIEIRVRGPLATGLNYTIKRSTGPTIIAKFYGNAAGDADASAEFEFLGGLWELGFNGGGGSAGGVEAF